MGPHYSVVEAFCYSPQDIANTANNYAGLGYKIIAVIAPSMETPAQQSQPWVPAQFIRGPYTFVIEHV